MLDFFMAGPEAVHWELTAIDGGAFRLTVHHARGVTVEYFNTAAAALVRREQLDALLMTARGASSQGAP